jgi:hypothetical protein
VLTLVENCEVFDPEPTGRTAVLIGGNRVLKVGNVERLLDRQNSVAPSSM